MQEQLHCSQLTYLMQAGVLNMVRGHFLFALDLHGDVETNCTGNSTFVSPLLCPRKADGMRGKRRRTVRIE
ncbi:unnamed protein product [Protopolystoma xenopodis]|uniref:Uncharacterized protein n=1 Tax=Protopolystoma xenopodis TaxID=117903 RepID=A0A3S5FF40_9PLAT|nr:unnamed protein product [Protopolystoma xenopodis]